MEQNLLLTTERLKLGADLQRGWTANGALVLKHVPSQVYLNVSQKQLAALEAFGEGATVPEVFARLLRERRCLPLREFYELVLKACRAGVLCSKASRRPVHQAMAWPAWSMGERWRWPMALVPLLVLLGLEWRTPGLAGEWEWTAWAAGFVVAIVALSAGQMLAATILSGAGGEVYRRPPFESLAALHPRLDLRDSRLLRPVEQVLIALATQLPLSACLLAATIWFPDLMPALVFAWLLVWRPWGSGLARRLAALLSRCPHLDTDTDFLFHPNQRPQLHWRPWWRRWDWRVCGIELAWASLWSVLVARLVLGALGVGLLDVVAADAGYWLIALPGIGAALLLALMIVTVRRWRDGLEKSWRAARQRWEQFRRRQQGYVFPETEAALLRIAAGHPLLSLLNPYDRTTVVRSWRPAVFTSRTILASGEKTGHHIGLILSGRVTARRITPSGRRVAALTMEEGDLFGLPHGLRPDGGDEGTLEFRTSTPVAAMLMPADVFKQCVIEKLGAKTVYDLTYKLAFLQRLKVCAHWDAHAVGRFARLAQIAAYGDGEVIVREGEDTKWFYIVYQGVAQVRHGARFLSRLKTGDFFGEISLLQNSVAVADVVAQGSVRCLQIDRNNFLRFMTHNHHVALALERISSARLGHPIFPLKAAAMASAHPFVGVDRRDGVCYS